MSTRKFGYKNSNSKNGELSVRIKPEKAVRVKIYGKLVNRNAQSLVNEAIEEFLNKHEVELYENLPKEELIRLLLQRKG